MLIIPKRIRLESCIYFVGRLFIINQETIMRKIPRMMKVVMMLFFIFISSFSIFAQERTITGSISADEGGTPLAGVTITNTSTNKRTQTNQTGNFSIVASKGNKLTISFIGFSTKEIIIGDEKVINARLVAISKSLDDVVVTAYGQRRNKRELSYQAPVVKGDEIASTRRENFINSLSGRVPGLTVTSTSGNPGASAQIVLRGPISIGGNNQPLFVIDGVPANNSTFNQENALIAGNANNAQTSYANRNNDYTNRIADINPEDIESVTILKGPEAAALYGSDGASGAIVITTKKGTVGKAKVYYDNSFRIDQVYRFPDVQTIYSRGSNGIFDPNAYSTNYGFNMFGPKYADTTKMYDNLHHFFQNAFTQQHNISVEAGTADVNYRLSSSYLNQKGVVPNTGLEKLTFRFTGSAKISPKLNISSSWFYANSINNKRPKGLGSFYPNLITWPGDNDVRNYINSNGSRTLLKTGTSTYSNELDNPLWAVNKNPSQDKTDRLTGNVGLDYNPYQWWTINFKLGLDNFITDGGDMQHPQSYYGSPTGGYISNSQQIGRDLSGTLQSTFKKAIQKFTNSLTIGGFFDNNKYSVYAQKGEQLYEPGYFSINNTLPSTQAAKLTVSNVRKVRAWGMYNLGYNNMAFLSAGATYEGTSTLTSTFYNKSPYFGYAFVSGNIIFSDLAAVKEMKWLSFGKLRASYASSGKGPGASYVMDPRFITVTTTGGGSALSTTGGNPNLKPEFSKTLELGGEFRFLNSRLGIDIDYYNINSRDQIVPYRQSYGGGFVIEYLNGGTVVNKGVEIILTGNPVRAKNFNWDITLNFAHNKGTVVSMPYPYYYDSDTWLFGSVRSQISTGLPIQSLASFHLQKNNAGQVLINPTTGMPYTTTTYDFAGDRNPDYTIGIINNFTVYKDLNISFNLDVRKGGVVFNGNKDMMYATGTSKATLDREQPHVIAGVLNDGLQNTANPTKNTIAVIPFFTSGFYGSAFSDADFVESVNWLRLRDVTLAYRLPTSLLKKQQLIKSLTVFVTGTDLFMITNYSGVDPNVSGLNATSSGAGGGGIDFGTIPNPRGINIGLKAQF